MRAKVGDAVTLFDGSGTEFLACVQSIQRDRVQLQINERVLANRERKTQIHLAIALPKGDRQKVVIEKAVELGVYRLIPIRAQRSQPSFSEKSLDRWKRYVIEASKQCRRSRLMLIAEPITFESLLNSSDEMGKWIAHPYPEDNKSPCPTTQPPQSERLKGSTDRPQDGIVLAIGPEGGFTQEEFQAARLLGWERLDLGPRILRIETAALAAVCRFDAWG